jgi:hypothetical protein
VVKIYRVSGLKSAGSATLVARHVAGIQRGVRVQVDVEHGTLNVDGVVSDYSVAKAVRSAGCDYLGPIDTTDARDSANNIIH